ncbi:hypothetical protein DICVIV_06329 [Dictyocaulus viviparus]|uniref:Uncharacterized protein n=1 Tax=Dictyocaulus viviparus TaxID=29172 RepID=A0A0D8XUR7_DICVI|nr:hypothetical protein DICVIV_06329 [Dictyocaulus viviparus]
MYEQRYNNRKRIAFQENLPTISQEIFKMVEKVEKQVKNFLVSEQDVQSRSGLSTHNENHHNKKTRKKNKIGSGMSNVNTVTIQSARTFH